MHQLNMLDVLFLGMVKLSFFPICKINIWPIFQPYYYSILTGIPPVYDTGNLPQLRTRAKIDQWDHLHLGFS